MLFEMCQEEGGKCYIERGTRTGILRVDFGGAVALGGGERELHFRHRHCGSDRDVGCDTKFGHCVGNDAEGRPDSDDPGETEPRKADFEDFDVWGLEGALGAGIHVESSGNVSGKTARERLLRHLVRKWWGRGG